MFGRAAKAVKEVGENVIDSGRGRLHQVPG